MRKLFFYELRRLIGTKSFAGLLAVCLCFGWQILTTKTICGVADTAPFSPWSFGSYLADVMPVLCAALLFFLWNLFSGKARNVQVLTAATPVSWGWYLLVKCAAAAVAWLALVFFIILLGLGFLLALFGASVPIGWLLLSATTVVLPVLVFVLGIGFLCGRIHPALLIVFLALMLALNLLPLPSAADLLSADFFSQYPLTLGVLDPAFSMPLSVLIGKCICTILGAGVLFLAILHEAKRKAK